MRFGRTNGLAEHYRFESKEYVRVCETAARESAYAVDAMVGMLAVMNAGRPTFSMVYPCHSPSTQRWFRLWVQSQMPESPTIIMAHTLLGERLMAHDIESASNRATLQRDATLMNQPICCGGVTLHRDPADR